MNGHPRTQAAADIKDINKDAASLHLREKSWPAVVLSPIKLLSRPDLPPSGVPIRRVATISASYLGLVPLEESSGQRRGRPSKNSDRSLRPY